MKLFLSKNKNPLVKYRMADCKITSHKISHLNQHSMKAVYFQSVNIL